MATLCTEHNTFIYNKIILQINLCQGTPIYRYNIVRVCMHAHVYLCIHMYIYVHVCTYTYPCIYTHIDTYTHMEIIIYTQLYTSHLSAHQDYSRQDLWYAKSFKLLILNRHAYKHNTYQQLSPVRPGHGSHQQVQHQQTIHIRLFRICWTTGADKDKLPLLEMWLDKQAHKRPWHTCCNHGNEAAP